MATIHDDVLENLEADSLDDLLADAVTELQRAELPSLAAAVGAARAVLGELAAETPVDLRRLYDAAEVELLEGLDRIRHPAPGDRWVEPEGGEA